MRLLLSLSLFLSSAAAFAQAGAPSSPVPAAEAAHVEPERAAEVIPSAALTVTGIRGRVTDASTGEPLILATVNVVAGGTGSTETDLEGNFQLLLPPGSYTLRVWYDLYVGVDVKNIRVGGGMLEQNVSLKPVEGSFEQEVVVIGVVDRKSESGLLLDRKLANSVTDAISSEAISRSPDSNAGDAVKRVTSATVVGRNVYLRGLGGRYAATVVNGVSLPSTDPDGHQTPLDLFPNSLLSTLSVQKTFGAEMSGAFAGGVLGIETNSYPESLVTQMKVSLGANTQTTFRAREGFNGSGSFLGLGTSRPLAGLPDGGALTVRDPNAEAVSESFRNVWSTQTAQGLPSGSAALSVGNTHRWSEGRALGYLASVTVSRGESAQTAQVRNFRIGESDELIPRDDYSSLLGSIQSSLGALASVGYQLDADNDLGALSLFSRNAESTAQQLVGFSDNDLANFDATRLKETIRTLSFNQVRGSHRFGDFTAKWQGNLQLTHAEEPDTRDMLYLEDALGVRRYRQAANSGERFLSTLSDFGGGGSAQLRWAKGALSVTGGASAQLSTRAFDARRFQFVWIGDEPEVLSLSPEQMLSADNVGTEFLATESTFKTDRYQGSQALFGAFLSAELPLTESLRAVAGARLEVFTQRLASNSPYATGQIPNATDRTYAEPMPSLNVIWAATPKTNVRGGYSFTVARPGFREIAPFLYYDAVRRRSVSGNPELVSSRIHNVDARWEWFPSDEDVVSVGGFYKHFLDPIEQVVVSSNQGDLGFRNAEQATVLGLELEARTSLGRFHPVLAPVRVGSNVSLIHSQVSLGAHQQVSTSGRRPLQGQSPFVVNANLGYLSEPTRTEVTVLYNVFGARLSEVGFNGLPDTYEQPFHRVDLTVAQELSRGLRLKVTGSNLLNQSTVFTQQTTEVFRARPGATFTAQLEWSPL